MLHSSWHRLFSSVLAASRFLRRSGDGQVQARLTLQGLAEGQSYGVYCTAEDEDSERSRRSGIDFSSKPSGVPLS